MTKEEARQTVICSLRDRLEGKDDYNVNMRHSKFHSTAKFDVYECIVSKYFNNSFTFWIKVENFPMPETDSEE